MSEILALGISHKTAPLELRERLALTEGRAVSVEDVKRYVKENLAAYKVPRDVHFLDELPRTSTGKVLKRELRDA